MTHSSHKKQSASAVPVPVSIESKIPVGIEPSESDLSEVLSSASDDSVLTNKESWILRWGIFGCICIVGATLLIVTYRLTLSQWESGSAVKEQMMQEKSIVSMSPTPSHVPFDRSGIAVYVVNASGVAGRARTMVDALMKYGYQDGGVETAPVQEQTVVYVSGDIQVHSADIQKDIATNGISGEVKMLEGKSHTVKIILGTK